MQKLLPGLLVACLAFLIYSWGDSNGEYRASLEGQVKMQEKEVQLQTARAEAAEREINQQREQAAEFDRIKTAHDQTLAEMQRTAAADRIVSDGLRSDISNLRNKLGHAQNSGASVGQQLDYATKASVVLTELYGSCVAERRDLAESLERTGVQLSTIAAQYNKIRGQ